MKITVYRPMPYLTAAFGVGCAIAYVGKVLFEIHWILGCLAVILIVSIGGMLRIRFSLSVPFFRSSVHEEQNDRKIGIRSLKRGITLMILLGCLRCSILYLWEGNVSKEDFALSSIHCIILQKEEASFGSYKYVIQSPSFTGKAFLYLSQSLEIGDWFTADLRLNRIRNDGNPGEFDQVTYQRARGIYYQAKASQVRLIQDQVNINPLTKGTLWGQKILYHSRHFLMDRLQLILKEKEAGFLSAMLLGEDQDLDPVLKSTFRIAGISHLLVISGLHLGIVYSILKMVLERFKNVRLQSSLQFLFLAMYVFLTGAALSTLRAWIFCSVSVFQKRLSGKADRINTLFLTALILLVWNPLNLLDTGFQLSFGCVLGISALQRWETAFFFLGKKIRKAVITMITVNLISMPLSIWYFGSVSPYQFLLNLILIPAMGIIVPFAFVILLLSIFWIPGALACAEVFSFLFSVLTNLVKTVLTFPYASIAIARPPFLVMILYGGLVFFLRYFAVLFKQQYHARMITVVLIGTILLVWNLEPRTRVTFLNVGQGDCCVVEAQGQVWLVDAGPHYAKALRPYLTVRGITQIDGILVSHFDKDHIQSLEEILDDPSLSIRQLFLPDHAVHENSKQESILDKARQKGTKIQYLHAGMSSAGEKSIWTCLSPEVSRDYPDENSASMVLLFDMDGKRFLFCGDADFYAEACFASQIREPVDVIKAGHHGSSTSSSQFLLERVNPETAIISCAKDNCYGHPHTETVQRFQQIGTTLLITYETGAIQYRKEWWGWSQTLGKKQ